MTDAACTRDPDLFAKVIDLTVLVEKKEPRRSTRAVVAEAKAICSTCPIRMACLEAHGGDFRLGVVGGMTDDERQVIWEGATA